MKSLIELLDPGGDLSEHMSFRSRMSYVGTYSNVSDFIRGYIYGQMIGIGSLAPDSVFVTVQDELLWNKDE